MMKTFKIVDSTYSQLLGIKNCSLTKSKVKVVILYGFKFEPLLIFQNNLIDFNLISSQI